MSWESSPLLSSFNGRHRPLPAAAAVVTVSAPPESDNFDLVFLVNDPIVRGPILACRLRCILQRAHLEGRSSGATVQSSVDDALSIILPERAWAQV